MVSRELKPKAELDFQSKPCSWNGVAEVGDKDIWKLCQCLNNKVFRAHTVSKVEMKEQVFSNGQNTPQFEW